MSEIETLKEELDCAIKMLASWCVAVQENGSGWDDWDKYYKDAAYNPCLIREKLDIELERQKKIYNES